MHTIHTPLNMAFCAELGKIFTTNNKIFSTLSLSPSLSLTLSLSLSHPRPVYNEINIQNSLHFFWTLFQILSEYEDKYDKIETNSVLIVLFETSIRKLVPMHPSIYSKLIYRGAIDQKKKL